MGIEMIIFLVIVSAIYIWDLRDLIESRRIRDIVVLSIVMLLTSAFGVFFLSNPHRTSLAILLLHLFKIEH